MIDLITKEFVEDYENGKVTDAYKVFGSHVTSNGVEFATYAPNAKKVRLRINSDTFIRTARSLVLRADKIAFCW